MHKGTNTPCFRDTCIFYLEAAICRGVSKACYHWHLIFQFSLHQNNKILKQLTSAQRPKRWIISEGIGGVLTMEKVKFHGGQISESLTYYVRKGQPNARGKKKCMEWEAEIINKLRILKWTDGERKIRTRISEIIVMLTQPLKITQTPVTRSNRDKRENWEGV